MTLDIRNRSDGAGPADRRGVASAPGRRTITSQLPARTLRGADDALKLSGDPATDAPQRRSLDTAGPGSAPEPVVDDPFGLHLLGASQAPVQAKASSDRDSADATAVHATAQAGVAAAAAPLPFLENIQAAFGPHDVGHIKAQIGGPATDASRAIGASAYATGDRVAFAGAPDLHTAAHEAAHVVQQRAGVALKGGVGQVGDAYEQHADAVADQVVAGRSAESLLEQMARPNSPPGPQHGGSADALQRQATNGSATMAANLGVSPLAVVFPATAVGATARAAATLTNHGAADVAVDAIDAAPPFSADLPAGNSLAPAATTTLALAFRPTPPMVGHQQRELTIDLQDGSRVALRVSGDVRPFERPAPAATPATGETPAPLDLDGGGAGAAPKQCRPTSGADQCAPGEFGQFEVKALRATRIHNPGSDGEFRDPVATTLYPQDHIEFVLELTGAPKGDLSAWLRDTTGLLNVRSTAGGGQTVTVVAEALRLGKTHGTLEVYAGSDAIVRTSVGAIEVVPALADSDGRKNDSQRVRTTDIEAAIRQVNVTARSVLQAQAEGVHAAKAKLTQQPAPSTMPWYAELFTLGAEAALAFVTAGIGNRLGRALSQRTVGQRDWDLGNLPVFDMESAFGTGLKEGLKHLAREHVLTKAGKAGLAVQEQWAIDLFCDAQIHALTKAALDLEGEANNGAKTYKDLEARQPGLGLATAEAHRHALMATKPQAQSDAEHATVLEWFKTLSQSTHGTLRSKVDSQSQGEGGEATTGGSDLGRAGRGHLDVFVAGGAPSAPPALQSMAIAGIANDAPTVLRGTVKETGLPFVVHLGNMRIKRNETGQVWIETTGTMAVLGGDLSLPHERYLYQKGTGRADWSNRADLRVGMEAGADRLLAEVEVFTVRIS